MFNRLLSMDEHNQEVLDLLRSLHSMPSENRSRIRLIPIGLGALALTAATSLLLWPKTTDEAISTSDAEQEEAAEDVIVEAATNPEVTVDAPPAIVATEREPVPGNPRSGHARRRRPAAHRQAPERLRTPRLAPLPHAL